MLRKAGIVMVAAAFGVGSALGVAACGEDRPGEVEIEDGTGTAGTGTAATGTVGTVGTETEGTGTVETEAPETETGEAETETTP